MLVNATHQSIAPNLTIGMRIPPQIIVRAADYRPYELQDLLPADMRFKIIILTGDAASESQHLRLSKLAEDFAHPDSFLQLYTPKGKARDSVFDILTIMQGKKESVNYTDVPSVLRTHWSKYCRVTSSL